MIETAYDYPAVPASALPPSELEWFIGWLSRNVPETQIHKLRMKAWAGVALSNLPYPSPPVAGVALERFLALTEEK